jgi:hypothetical protein
MVGNILFEQGAPEPNVFAAVTRDHLDHPSAAHCLHATIDFENVRSTASTAAFY